MYLFGKCEGVFVLWRFRLAPFELLKIENEFMKRIWQGTIWNGLCKKKKMFKNRKSAKFLMWKSSFPSIFRQFLVDFSVLGRAQDGHHFFGPRFHNQSIKIALKQTWRSFFFSLCSFIVHWTLGVKGTNKIDFDFYQIDIISNTKWDTKKECLKIFRKSNKSIQTEKKSFTI